MKLLSLRLDVAFRSLHRGFQITFLEDWDPPAGGGLSEEERRRCYAFHPYCLAGVNGSGKSNVLEALACIFYHIECIYLQNRPEDFDYDAESGKGGFLAKESMPDAFTLEYLIPSKQAGLGGDSPEQDGPPILHVRISKKKGGVPVIQRLDKHADGKTKATALSERDEVKDHLPRFVLAYSSGHNETLSLPFLKMRFIHFDEYCDRLKDGVSYDGRPEGRLIYLDEQFSQAILLCHFLFPNPWVQRVFAKHVGLQPIQRFRLIIRRFHLVDLPRQDPSALDPVNPGGTPLEQVELTSILSSNPEAGEEPSKYPLGLIEKLIKCATSHDEDRSRYDDDETGYDLVLDYLVNEATREAFQFHFNQATNGSGPAAKDRAMAASALQFFGFLRSLLTLNYYRVPKEIKAELYGSESLYLNETIPLPASDERILRFKDFEIEKKGVTDGKLYAKSLSDGEHQLVHTIGLCSLFRYEPALFLLDEPETHLNPSWRASYVSVLRAAFGVAEQEPPQEEKPADEKATDKKPVPVMREVLLTTHSPFVISDCRRENVRVFTKLETLDGSARTTDRVRCAMPDFQTFGASANAITIKIFEQTDTIGDFAMSKLDAFRKRLFHGSEPPDQLISDADRELGESVEKVLFVHLAAKKREQEEGR